MELSKVLLLRLLNAPSSWCPPSMSSHSHLLPVETTYSFSDLLPSRESASQLPSSTTSTPSLYVTLKVLQLVQTFRKRVKTRVQDTKTKPSKKVADEFCLAFERQAFEEIDKYLGRKIVHSRKTLRKSERATTATEQVRADRVKRYVTSPRLS